MEPQTETFKPPYMSFQTFWNFIAELGSKPLPPRIDRSLMGSKSGTDQNNLTSALVTFRLVKLVDGKMLTQPVLYKLAEGDEAQRKDVLAGLVREFYPKPLAVSEANDTEAALTEAFRDAYDLNAAETRRKCETFFLHALRTAELPVSPHFKQTRPGSGAPGTTKPRKATARLKANETKTDNGKPDQPKDTATTEGRTRRVTLGSGGWVALAYDFDLFDASNEDREFVLGIVQMLRDYETAHPTGAGES